MTASDDAEPRVIRALLEYDGAAYGGWQYQETVPTIQGELLKACEQMFGERPTLHAAARTDAGVHARAQVVSFATTSQVNAKRFAPGLNYYLPDEISVHQTEEAPGFNARFDSKSKRYRYRVYAGPQPSALEGGRAWIMRPPLDRDAMQRAAEHLIGDLDFNAFRSVHCDADHAQRLMYSIEVTQQPRPPVGETFEITFHANAYCRHMCRIIAGTLIEVGRGVREVDDVRAARDSRDRTRAGMTAPGNGLTLLEVLY